jgi:curved DNA-binding protein CbpA
VDQSKDYYAILGVLPSADDAIIKAVYRALAKKWHPDTFVGDKKLAEQKLKEINEAYGVLSNTATRSQYDALRKSASGQQRQREYEEPDDAGRASFEAELAADWKFVLQYYPAVDFMRFQLTYFSNALALTFQVILLEMKAFAQAERIKQDLIKDFLRTHFGDQKIIQQFAEDLIQSGLKNSAKELNRLIRLTGSPTATDAKRFIAKISEMAAVEKEEIRAAKARRQQARDEGLARSFRGYSEKQDALEKAEREKAAAEAAKKREQAAAEAQRQREERARQEALERARREQAAAEAAKKREQAAAEAQRQREERERQSAIERAAHRKRQEELERPLREKLSPSSRAALEAQEQLDREYLERRTKEADAAYESACKGAETATANKREARMAQAKADRDAAIRNLEKERINRQDKASEMLRLLVNEEDYTNLYQGKFSSHNPAVEPAGPPVDVQVPPAQSSPKPSTDPQLPSHRVFLLLALLLFALLAFALSSLQDPVFPQQ